MNGQYITPRSDKMKGRGWVFTFSLISLICFSVYFVRDAFDFFVSFDSYTFFSYFLRLSYFLSTFLYVSAMLLLFLLITIWHNRTAAKVFFPLIFLLLLARTLLTLLTRGISWLDSIDLAVLFYIFLEPLMMLILYLLATLNAFRVFKGIVPIILAASFAISSAAQGIGSVVRGLITTFEYINLGYDYVGSDLSDYLFGGLHNLGFLFFCITIILYV